MKCSGFKERTDMHIWRTFTEKLGVTVPRDFLTNKPSGLRIQCIKVTDQQVPLLDQTIGRFPVAGAPST